MIFKKNYGYVKLPEGKTHIKSYIPVQSCNMLQTLEVANQVDGFQAFIPGKWVQNRFRIRNFRGT